MDRKTENKRSIGLTLALGVSVLLHLLLLLVSLWMPLGTEEAVTADTEEESLIRFTFAPQTERDVEGRIEGDLPVPPQTAPSLEPDFVPQGAPTLEPPTSQVPLVPPEPFEERQAVEPDGDEAVAEELEATPASDLPLADEGPLQVDPREKPELGQRLQEFGRALDRAREARPRGPAGSPEARNVFVPDISVSPATGFGVGNLVFESRDYDWNDYARQIYFAIWRAWHNRLYQTVDDFEKWSHEGNQFLLDHQTQIRFVIEGSGQVTGIAIEFPSGCVPLDDSAADALAEVILPPLPADFPRDSEVVHARFIAFAEIRDLRPGLRRLKMLGYF